MAENDIDATTRFLRDVTIDVDVDVNGNINMDGNSVTGVEFLTFNDRGGDGSNWAVAEEGGDQSLQFKYGTTDYFRIDDGTVEVVNADLEVVNTSGIYIQGTGGNKFIEMTNDAGPTTSSISRYTDRLTFEDNGTDKFSIVDGGAVEVRNTQLNLTGQAILDADRLELGERGEPNTPATGECKIYLDSSDGDLKVKFDNGTVSTIATN